MSKHEFVKKWRPYLAGLALCGSASESKDTALQRGARVLEIPGEVEKLLERMYRDLACDPAETPPPTASLAGNGRGPGAAAHTNGRR